jgi:hypothetical protein
VGFTSVGMFGNSGGWGVGMPNHPLAVTIGGIASKPAVVDGRIEIREFLSVTLSFDHDVVDGAPAARFAQRFVRLVEEAYGSGLDHQRHAVGRIRPGRAFWHGTGLLCSVCAFHAGCAEVLTLPKREAIGIAALELWRSSC